MKKMLAVAGLLMISVLFAKEVRADGGYTPVLVVSSVTNQGYLYSINPSSGNTGGFLINNGGGILNWSQSVVASTNSLTVGGFPALSVATIAQLGALAPATTGQLVMCSNCMSPLCVSSSTTQGAWVMVGSTATTGVTGPYAICH